MTLDEIIKNSALFTDETLDNTNYLSAANRALAIINTECKTLFPFIQMSSETYTPMPKFWAFTLLSPYISYTTKMNDSSLSEAQMYLDEFYRALKEFKDNLVSLVDTYVNDDGSGEGQANGISPEFVSESGFGGVYEIDTSNAINIGFFAKDSNGGTW